MRVLYLSYNGLLDPLGQSQVLQYLVGLAGLGHRITLVTFEKRDEWQNLDHRRATRLAVDRAGIRWVPLSYHRRLGPFTTLYNVVACLLLSLCLVVCYRIQLVHARGYVTALVAGVLRTLVRVGFVFDPRSFWPDERVEMGLWGQHSFPYVVAKRLERWYLTTADAVVSLTASGVDAMRSYPYMAGKNQRFRVITTCTNLEMFRPAARSTTSGDGREPFTFGYLGTVGNPYLLDEVFDALRVARSIEGDARLLILNRRDHAHIKERALAKGIPMEAIELRALTHEQVPEQLRRMSAGVVFIEATPCRRSCAPTKVGELLASGVPCLANAGVGDLEHILQTEGVGTIIPNFSDTALADGVKRLMALCRQPGIPERCADVARRFFALDDGIRAYDKLYRELAVSL